MQLRFDNNGENTKIDAIRSRNQPAGLLSISKSRILSIRASAEALPLVKPPSSISCASQFSNAAYASKMHLPGRFFAVFLTVKVRQEITGTFPKQNVITYLLDANREEMLSRFPMFYPVSKFPRFQPETKHRFPV